jgi:pimeloyl-ACP methyl ester carboxylesterase
MPEAFELPMPSGERLHGSVDASDRPGPRPTVVLCHGFKGFQEWCFLPYLAELLAARGFTAVRFNFRGSGMRPGDELVADLDAFRRATFSRDLEDLRWVLAELPRLDPARIDPHRVGLFGHSRGGGTSVLAAAGSDVAALVTWAAVSTFERLSAQELEAWRASGTHTIVNARTGQVLELGLDILDDVESHPESLDIRAAASRITIPWLAVHGSADATVPVDEGRRLAERAGPAAEYLEIPGAGHTFDVTHPLARPSPALIQAMNATQTWFRRHLE